MIPRFAALAMAAALAGCGDAVVSRVVELDDCADLRAQGEFALVLQVDGSPQVELYGTEEQLDSLDVRQQDGRLALVSSASDSPRVRLQCPGLRRVELIGAVLAEQSPSQAAVRYDKIAVYGKSRFSAARLSAEHLDLRAAGSARIMLAAVVAETVQLLIGGASEVVIDGEATALDAEIAGHATLMARGLQVQRAALKGRGAGRATISATAHLHADLQDSASLAYTGNPDLAIDRRDGATISKD